MLAAPSCLCECGARDGLAQVGRTCRAAWASANRAHVLCRVAESLKYFCELLRLSVFARPARAITCW